MSFSKAACLYKTLITLLEQTHTQADTYVYKKYPVDWIVKMFWHLFECKMLSCSYLCVNIIYWMLDFRVGVMLNIQKELKSWYKEFYTYLVNDFIIIRWGAFYCSEWVYKMLEWVTDWLTKWLFVGRLLWWSFCYSYTNVEISVAEYLSDDGCLDV